MKQNNKKLFIKIISILTITTGIIYASSSTCFKHDVWKPDYSKFTTIELQNKVEKLAIEDKLPFEMGIELMKRWQTEKSNAQ